METTKIYVFIILCQIYLCDFFILVEHVSDKANYSMYVWTHGFDSTVSGCTEEVFFKWNTANRNCFTHTWNTPSKRQWLWNTCNIAGREISKIFISDMHHKLQNAYELNSCSTDDIQLIKTMLVEGHSKVPGLRIYALFAVSDVGVSEKDLVKYVVWYNDHCAVSQTERFDGVATNNEAFSSIKTGSIDAKLQYLDNLQKVKDEAMKQINGHLSAHYSVSWNWGHHHGNEHITWRGKRNDVVGYTIFPQISDRMNISGYDYSISQSKEIYVTFYTNKESPCQIAFFPQTCHLPDRTEGGMYKVFDQFDQHGIGKAKPCIHYFRGIYSSGGHRDWPAHH
ncbi:hypothetical protein KUTeg_002437 [Tegillarca granosa]|uniref:Uncharacterized protein n=1 Tax=Tegillarca granosa TaxID=220873 RepID=A0ABQ9FYQ4_TEGGR|nr:hypothetical protein KUTeg_002437 [Tegillarca granosa]